MRRIAVSFIVATVTSSVAVAQPAQPREFLPEVQLIYRVAACGGGGAVPAALWAKDAKLEPKYTKVVDEHCKALEPYYAKFRVEFFDKARAWLVEHMPKKLPTTVVYTFGGGDLISALFPFPDATDITTLSLELAGDPRGLTTLTPAELEKTLYAFRTQVGPIVSVSTNSSVNLSAGQAIAIPAQLSEHLIGLAVAGYEITSVKYFSLDDTGALTYLTQADFDADTKNGKSLRGNWKNPAFAQSFANVEVSFKKPGESTIRVHRHIAWNLANDYLKAHPGALKYIEAKGKVTQVTKGGHYLLWKSEFSTIRQYILDHLVFMLSDSTGIAPTHATPAGMVQEIFGTFVGTISEGVDGSTPEKDAIKQWKGNKVAAPFRYGYLDKAGHPHFMFTHPK